MPTRRRTRSSLLSPVPGSAFDDETRSSSQLLDDEDDLRSGLSLTPEPVRKPTRTLRSSLNNKPTDSSPSDYSVDREKYRRRTLYKARYESFVAAANLRSYKRHDLKTRNRIWQDAMDKAQARIEAIEQEKEDLRKKIDELDAAREEYNEENKIVVTREEDVKGKEEWKKFFELESDVLDVNADVDMDL